MATADGDEAGRVLSTEAHQATAPTLTFNHLLGLEGVEADGVRLVRHQDPRVPKGALWAIWRSEPQRIERYQEIQKADLFKGAHTIASFVVTPQDKTVFVGLWAVKGSGIAPAGWTESIINGDDSGRVLYDLQRDPHLQPYVGRLVIDWGTGTRTFVQRAERQPKPVIEIGPQDDPEFPGAAGFRWDTDNWAALYPKWAAHLKDLKGVYLLVDVRNGKQYVGSATGQERLYGRLSAYAKGGHGGNVKMQEAGHRTYQITLLETASTMTPDEEILKAEYRWMERLLTPRFGLN